MDYIEKFLIEDAHIDQDVKHSLPCTDHSQNGFSPNDQAVHENGRISNNGDLPSDLSRNTDESLTAPYDGMAVSLEAYWDEFYGQTEHTYEWNNGILEAKPMAKLIQVKAYLWFLNLLNDYLFGNAIAEMTFLETPFQFNIPGQTKIRIPDLAVVLNNNPIPLGLHDNTYGGIFDICIESVSDSKRSEIERDTIIKRDEYAQGGVMEYYILDEIHPPSRGSEAAFYRLGPGGIYQPIQPVNGVIQSAVLPGFQFRINDLESRPGSLEMFDDPIYQGFTSPVLRSERKRAERELQAEQERAEQELQAEQERAEQELQAAQERADQELQAAQERADQELKAVQEHADQELKSVQERADQELQAKQAKIDQIRAYLDAQGISLSDDLMNL